MYLLIFTNICQLLSSNILLSTTVTDHLFDTCQIVSMFSHLADVKACKKMHQWSVTAKCQPTCLERTVSLSKRVSWFIFFYYKKIGKHGYYTVFWPKECYSNILQILSVCGYLPESAYFLQFVQNEATRFFFYEKNLWAFTLRLVSSVIKDGRQ